MAHSTEATEVLERFHARLAEAGLKSTHQRDVIVAKFFALNRHISVDELLDEARRESPRIGYATVYRTLKLLVDHGFATPRQFGDGQTRFDPADADGDEHDHVICVDCRRVIEFADETITARVNQIVRESGNFALTRQRLELYVRCRDTVCVHRGAAAAEPEGDDDRG